MVMITFVQKYEKLCIFLTQLFINVFIDTPYDQIVVSMKHPCV